MSAPSSQPPAQPPAARLIKCPTCSKMTAYAPTNAFRPFCSDRCKTNDLGAWAQGNYRIPVNQKVIDQPIDYTIDDDSVDNSEEDSPEE